MPRYGFGFRLPLEDCTTVWDGETDFTFEGTPDSEITIYWDICADGPAVKNIQSLAQPPFPEVPEKNYCAVESSPDLVTWTSHFEDNIAGALGGVVLGTAVSTRYWRLSYRAIDGGPVGVDFTRLYDGSGNIIEEPVGGCPCPTPDVPTGLCALRRSTTEALFHWNGVPGADGYDLDVRWVQNRVFSNTIYSVGAIDQYLLVSASGLGGVESVRIRARNECGESAWSASVSASPRTIPQCATRTYCAFNGEDTGDIPLTGDLWEVYRNGFLVDSGNRYDRFGERGWNVLYPGLSGEDSLTVTAAPDASIGGNYIVRVNEEGFPFLPFEVTAAACPGFPPLGDQRMFIFSTGRLLAYPKLPLPALLRVSVGTPPAATDPLANLSDASPATLSDLTRTDGTNYQYLSCDLGSVQPVGAVLLSAVTQEGGANGAISVYVSNAVIGDGNFAGATALPGIGVPAAPFADVNLRFGQATPVSGRYVYIVPTAGTGTDIGQVDIRGAGVAFAALQNIRINPQFEQAILRGPSWLNNYSEADACYDGAVEIEAQHADFAYQALETLLGITATGTTTKVITADKTTKPPPFALELEGRTLDDKAVFFTAWECYAPGFTWQFNRDAFGEADFRAAVYHSDAAGPVWQLSVEQ